MNNIVSTFAKFCACFAVVIGAPLITANAVNFTTAEVEKYLEVMSCQKIADLNKLPARCIDTD